LPKIHGHMHGLYSLRTHGLMMPPPALKSRAGRILYWGVPVGEWVCTENRVSKSNEWNFTKLWSPPYLAHRYAD